MDQVINNMQLTAVGRARSPAIPCTIYYGKIDN